MVGLVMLSMGSGLACITGSVNDANSRSGLDSVTVTATGACSGTGCVSSTTGRATSIGGTWFFDAYGDAAGASDVQLVLPATGQEALSLSFSIAGYKSAVLAHHPNYHSETFGTKSYLVSGTQAIYLCTNGAPDTDGDGLCDAAEAAYGTDPTKKDTDGDGFSDAAEVLGMIVGGSPVDLRYYGASPLHKDVFIYLDYYTIPYSAGLTQVTDAFASAPISNPDGTTGINLHIVMGNQIAAADQVANIIGPPSDWSVVDTIKNKYFPARYAPIMHYVLFANQYGSGTSSGISRGTPSHDLLVTLGTWPTPYGTQLQQAGTIMHELGHNLGLQHGGNEGKNNKPNYLSVMSYRYQVVGLFKDGVDGVLDYSRLLLGTVTENALVENNGMPPVAPTTAAMLSHYGAKFVPGLVKGTVNGPLDFNNNGVFDTGTEAVDLDGDGNATDTFNPSQNDWDALVYTGSSVGGGSIGDGIMAPVAGLTVPPIVAPEHMEPELDHP
jgi:hypothetical protein